METHRLGSDKTKVVAGLARVQAFWEPHLQEVERKFKEAPNKEKGPRQGPDFSYVLRQCRRNVAHRED